MAVTYGFFNSVNGDRTYNAEDMSHYFKGLVSDGVYETVGDKLAVRASEGMTVTIGTGRALIDCHWLENDEVLSFTLAAADSLQTRYDYIVIKLDLNESVRAMSIEVMSTTPNNSTNVKYMTLARVRINPGATSITQTDIADMRGQSVCPYVTGIIKQVDTADLFAQYQEYMEQKLAAFDAWFQSLTEELIVDTYIQQYQNTYSISGNMETNERYPVGIPEYNRSKDVLFVNIDGITLVEGVDFTIDDSVYFPDVDGDGQVNANDASAILTAATNIGIGEPSGLTPEQELLADADRDGAITAGDASIVNTFSTETGVGHYSNSLSGWTKYLKDREICPVYITPLKSAYEEGRQLTFVVLKARVGSSSDEGLINRLASIVDVE